MLATIDALRQFDPDLEVLYVGRAGSLEERLAGAAGLRFAAISSGKFRRLHGTGRLRQLLNPTTIGPNLLDLLKVLAGVIQSLRLIGRYDPDMIFAKGGFVGLPVGIAARLMGRPFVIHESDLEPGLANRILGRWAAAVAVGFPAEYYRAWPTRSPKTFTGNPVRPELLRYHRLEGVKHFNFDERRPVVLVTGGSLGAASLNEAVVGCLEQLLETAQVIHLTGESDIDHVRFVLRRSGLLEHPGYVVKPFLAGDMGLALAAADVVVARAGAGTIAELAVLGKPTILVPNTQMAGHQVANARLLGRRDAARIIYGERLKPALLLAEIRRLLDSPDEAERLAEHLRGFAQPEAGRELARLIMSLATGSHN